MPKLREPEFRWALISRSGRMLLMGPYSTEEITTAIRRVGERVARVEIREIARKGKRK